MALSANKAVVALALAGGLLLSGCADYMNRWDRVSMRAGHAPDANSAIHTIEHFPAASGNADIKFGG